MEYQELKEVMYDGEPDELRAALADGSAVREDGNSLLHTAAMLGLTEQASVLLEAGIDPGRQDSGGRTPLHCALEAGNTEIARRLVEAGAPMDAEDRHGNRPLSKAVASGDWELLALLVEHGANPNHENKHGHSPWEHLQDWEDLPAVVAEAAERMPESRSEPDRTGLEAGLTRVDLDADDLPAWLWDRLVPLSGQADTLQGELLRAVEALRSEAQRNGNGNWGDRFERHVDFLDRQLCDETLFDAEMNAQTRRDLDRLRDSEHSPYLDDDLYDRLVDRIVALCRDTPTLVPNPREDE